MPAIKATGLSKSWSVTVPSESPSFLSRLRPARRTVDALRNLDLVVEEGEAVAFLGPNGAGKSTTIKILSGILHPDAGHAEVLGLVPWKDRTRLARRIGSVFGQKSQLWYHLPARDSFRLLGAIYDIDRPVLEHRVAELSERFCLGDFLDAPVRKLSLGQRIRCEIAGSLLHDPDILFLDEPTIGLDVVARQQIRDFLGQWNRDRKVTLFLTSHDLGDVESLCRRAILIHHGSLVLDQSLESLKSQAGRWKILDARFSRMPAGGIDTLLSILGCRHRPGGALAVRMASPRGADSPSADAVSAPAVQALEAGDARLRLRVDTRAMPVRTVLQALLTRGDLEDLTVEDEPLENLVGRLYRSSTREEAHAIARS